MTHSSVNLNVYRHSISIADETLLPTIAGHIRIGDRVLELGCTNGVLGPYLLENRQCVVDGVRQQTSLHEPPQTPLAGYRQVQTVKLEPVVLTDLFPDEQYDAIVCADILTHALNPEGILSECRRLLKSDGKLILSVPNAGYCGLLADLLQGNLVYREHGLLEKHQVRWFTRLSLARFMQEARWTLEPLTALERPLPDSEFQGTLDQLPPAVARHLLATPDAISYQFIGIARPATDETLVKSLCEPSDSDHTAQALFSAQVSVTRTGTSNDAEKITARGVVGKNRQIITFALPQGTDNQTCLQLSLADRPGFVHLYKISLQQPDGAVRWHWQADSESRLSLPDAPQEQMVWHTPVLAVSDAACVLLTGDASWIKLPIPALTLAETLRTPGARLEIDMGWPMSADYLALSGTIRPLQEKIGYLESAVAASRNTALQATESAQRAIAAAAELQAMAAAVPALQEQHLRWKAEYEQLRTHMDAIERSTTFKTAQQLARLKARADSLLGRAPAPAPAPAPAVDIIIPVYKDLEETQRCIQSVLRYARDNITASRLIVINDASPDSALTHWLRNEAKKQPGFLLLENEDNLGFVGTVNRGMTQSATNDVLLLNSDTEVANQWLDRLHAAAYRGANVGTVTPFSNNATICSYPRFCQENSLPPNYDTATLDALFAATHPGASIEIPTGVGFCMYIRRDCLQQIGLFDAESFGKGYGEENDFCQRAIKAGWRNLHALDTFVRHTGSVSFGTTKAPLEIEGAKKLRALHPTYETQVHEFIQADPARPYREAVDMRRLDANPHPRVLAVTHSLGGGTLRHIHELAAHLKDHITVLSMMPMADHDILIQWVADGEGMQRTFNWQKDPHQMVAWLRQVGVVHVHYHHLLGISLSMMRIHENLGVSYDFTAHDYYAACPQVSLATEQQTYCGERGIEQCRVCVSKRPTPRHESIEDWRLRHSIFLTQARNVLAPSQDATARLKKYYPHANPRHVPHIDLTPQQIQSLPAPSPYTISEGANLRVLILGAISQAKGGNLLEEISVAAAAAQAPIEFHLVGYPHRQLKTQPEASLTIHGPYKDRNLVSLIQRLKPNLVWFPAQIPETYSYTLSACLVAGIPVAAPDLGAFPERLKHRPWTWIRPWQTSASQWLAFFMEIREKHFITGNAPPVAPGAVVADLPGDATPWSYTKDYLRFTRPITRTNDNSAP